ncbi:MAG: type II toxin-antitoxin system VapC family toxin [Solirubrobacteraceae bacterium]
MLDTHALLWALKEPDRLSDRARDALLDQGNDVLVSAVSPWEIAIKVAVGRLSVSGDMPAEMERFGFAELPVRFNHAAAVRDLPLLHRDPFDRMLVAQARYEGLTLVTRDAQVRAYPVASLEA